MSQQRNSAASFEAGEDLEQYRRVCLNSSGTVYYADSAEYGIGVTQQAVSDGDHVAVRSFAHGGSCRVVASSATVVGKLVYASNDGKVAATGTLVVGTAMEAASGTGSIVEIWPHPGRALQSSSSSSSSSSASG